MTIGIMLFKIFVYSMKVATSDSDGSLCEVS